MKLQLWIEPALISFFSDSHSSPPAREGHHHSALKLWAHFFSCASRGKSSPRTKTLSPTFWAGEGHIREVWALATECPGILEIASPRISLSEVILVDARLWAADTPSTRPPRLSLIGLQSLRIRVVDLSKWSLVVWDPLLSHHYSPLFATQNFEYPECAGPTSMQVINVY